MPFGSNGQRVVVLDSSVLVAVLLGENPVTDFAETLNSARELLVGAPTSAEAGIVLQNRQGAAALLSLL